MNFPTLVFYVFAALLVFAALRVITTRNPVHAALWLVLSFFSAAGVWLLLQAEFLAIALVLVYVGAVMVLFLFVVMMLDVNFDKLREHFRSYIPVGATVGLLILLELVLVVAGGYASTPAGTAPAAASEGYSNTKALGLIQRLVRRAGDGRRGREGATAGEARVGLPDPAVGADEGGATRIDPHRGS